MDLKNSVRVGIYAYLMWTLLVASTGHAEALARKYVVNTMGERSEPVVAIENVCAWPNLSQLKDGSLIATIHNQPAHLKRPADVDCWASKDGGKTWTKRGTPAPRDNERVARGNVAAGVAHNGDLLVITSGWSEPETDSRGTLLPILVSRSADGGRSWRMDAKAFPAQWPKTALWKASPKGYLVPFGDIIAGEAGRLYVGMYGGNTGAGFVYRSEDDGKTWGNPKSIDTNAVIHEPALFHLGSGKWLAAARFATLTLYRSEDNAQTWQLQQPLTGEHEYPGHFMRLKDGTLLLSYGNRVEPKGVDIRFSQDEGVTWSAPLRVMDFQGDGGYPSSVQRADGQVVTAYYAKQITGHDGYHMGVVIWDPVLTERTE